MDYFVWNFDPEIFRIGSFGPRYYGLMFAFGFLVCYKVMEDIWRRESHSETLLQPLLVHLMVGTIVGARLGHCLFYDPEYYLSNPLRILKVWEGGLASHGGTLGCIISVWLFCRKHPNEPYGWLADRLATAIPFCAACIRIGNFFNSEIVGKATDVPWAIIFTRWDQMHRLPPTPRHPAMLYEAASYMILFIILFGHYHIKKGNIRPGSQIGMLMIWIFSSRIYLENFKENQKTFEDNMALNMGQILSIPFVIAGILLFTGIYKKFIPTGYGHLEQDLFSRLPKPNEPADIPQKSKAKKTKKK